MEPILDIPTIRSLRNLVSRIYVDEQIQDYIIALVYATRRRAKVDPKLGGLIRYGASPRATINLTLAAKARAFIDGRGHVTPRDVRSIACDVLRHRILLTGTQGKGSPGAPAPRTGPENPGPGRCPGPKDMRIDKAIQEEKNRMADLITRRAAEFVEPALAQKSFNSDALERGRRELTRAVELNPEQARARKLKAEAEARLEAGYLAEAERAAAAIQEKNEARKNLALATTAVEFFRKTLDVNAENLRAKSGLERLETMLAELHAKAAARDLAEARQQLAADPQPDLKKAVGYLETATQNFARSLAMRPDDEQTSKGHEEAKQLLTETRDQLDAERQRTAQDEGPAPPPANGRPQETQLYKRHQKPEASTAGGGFWNRAVRDW